MWIFIAVLTMLLAILAISKAFDIRIVATQLGPKGDALAIEAGKLAKAQRALLQSEKRLEKLRNSLHLTISDISELKLRIQGRDGQLEDAAQLLLAEELIHREEEKARLDQKIGDAVTDHNGAQRVVQQFSNRLRDIRDDVEQLKVKRDLATASADAAGLAADLNLGLSVARDIGEQKEEILALKARAEVDRRVTPAGEVRISPTERLAALKQEQETS